MAENAAKGCIDGSEAGDKNASDIREAVTHGLSYQLLTPKKAKEVSFQEYCDAVKEAIATEDSAKEIIRKYPYAQIIAVRKHGINSALARDEPKLRHIMQPRMDDGLHQKFDIENPRLRDIDNFESMDEESQQEVVGAYYATAIKLLGDVELEQKTDDMDWYCQIMYEIFQDSDKIKGENMKAVADEIVCMSLTTLLLGNPEPPRSSDALRAFGHVFETAVKDSFPRKFGYMLKRNKVYKPLHQGAYQKLSIEAGLAPDYYEIKDALQVHLEDKEKTQDFGKASESLEKFADHIKTFLGPNGLRPGGAKKCILLARKVFDRVLAEGTSESLDASLRKSACQVLLKALPILQEEEVVHIDEATELRNKVNGLISSSEQMMKLDNFTTSYTNYEELRDQGDSNAEAAFESFLSITRASEKLMLNQHSRPVAERAFVNMQERLAESLDNNPEASLKIIGAAESMNSLINNKVKELKTRHATILSLCKNAAEITKLVAKVNGKIDGTAKKRKEKKDEYVDELIRLLKDGEGHKDIAAKPAADANQNWYESIKDATNRLILNGEVARDEFITTTVAACEIEATDSAAELEQYGLGADYGESWKRNINDDTAWEDIKKLPQAQELLDGVVRDGTENERVSVAELIKTGSAVKDKLVGLSTKYRVDCTEKVSDLTEKLAVAKVTEAEGILLTILTNGEEESKKARRIEKYFKDWGLEVPPRRVHLVHPTLHLQCNSITQDQTARQAVKHEKRVKRKREDA